MIKYVKFFVILILCGGICLFSLISCKNKMADLNELNVVRAKRGDLAWKILETGVVSSLIRINIKSKTGGRISTISVEEGDKVRKGDRLIFLDNKDALGRSKQTRVNLKRSQAEIDQARISLKYAQANRKNCQELFKRGLIARYELDQAKRDLNIAGIRLNSAKLNEQYHQEAYLTSLNALEETVIKAPISGVIIKRMVEEGEVVAPVSQVLLAIGDLSRLKIITEINEIDINKIGVGLPVEIKFEAINNHFYQGKVSKVASVGKKVGNIVTYSVEVEILDSDNQVKPDMSCDIDLIIEKAENVVYLPIGAVMKRENKNLVMLKKGEEFIWREVKLGIVDDGYVAIEEGVKEGEEVQYFTSSAGKEEGRELPGKVLHRDFK